MAGFASAQPDKAMPAAELGARLAAYDTATTPTKPTGKTPADPEPVLPAFKWGTRDEWQLQFSGRTRLRLEARRNFDGDKSVQDDDNLGLLQTRLAFDLRYRKTVRAFVEILDGRAFDQRTDLRQTDRFDAHQAFLEFATRENSPWRLRVGRQEMKLGDKRLVDSASWGNLPATWTGLRAIRTDTASEWTFFLLRPDTYDRQMSALVTSGRRQLFDDRWFYGAYGTLKIPRGHETDFYALGLSDTNADREFPAPVTDEDGNAGTSDRFTVGSRLRGPLWKREAWGALDYGVEGACQFGRASGDEIRAFMLHGDLTVRRDSPWKPSLMLEVNMATGDRRAGDGMANTFNPLYGTVHTPYGIMDFVRLQNLREVALRGQVKPSDRLTLEMELHQYWLDSKSDAWYGGGGSSRGRDATGGSGREIGHEISLVGTYKLTKRQTLEAGLARFTSGAFAEAVGRGDASNLGYIQWTLAF
ncbi:MAG: alginate export family protein [Candidatus Sumerlaeaceae bacterium]|nr:alginate export family protein [Candidatus Sumerlaeaceae bacterium]